MIMTYDEATQLKTQIEQTHAGITCDLRQYEQAWVVIVTNPRTNESFGVVSPTDWQERLDMMQGMQGSADAGSPTLGPERKARGAT